MGISELPLELIVQIAEISHEVWYLLSMTINKFGNYSIRPEIKERVMKRFGFQKLNTPSVTGYLLHGRRHGIRIETKVKNDGSLCVCETKYIKGKRHGRYQLSLNGVLRQECNYHNDKRSGWEVNYDKRGRKQSRFMWREDGEVLISEHICKKCRKYDFNFESCGHPNSLLETDFF